MDRASWIIVAADGGMLVLIVLVFLTTGLGAIFLAASASLTLYIAFRSARFAARPSRDGARGMYRLASITLGSIFASMRF